MENDNNFYKCEDVPNCEGKFSVWVGGSEVVDYLLTRDQAIDLALSYEAEGYDDVYLEKVED